MTPLISQVVEERDKLRAEVAVLRQERHDLIERVEMFQVAHAALKAHCRAHGVSTSPIDGIPPEPATE